MGFFETTYKVEHNTGSFFQNWIVELQNVSLKEAESYVNDHTGFFKEPKDKYRIVKE